MSTTSFVARVQNTLDALFRPTISVVETALTHDRAERDPAERTPTKRQYSESIKAVAGLHARVQRSRGKRSKLQQQLLEMKATTDAADKRLHDHAGSPQVIEVRQRAAKLRRDHPLHDERLTFRNVRLPRWMRLTIEAVIIIADWGVWFTLLMTGFGLSLTKPTSATDPTKIYNPDWFVAHPAEWVTAFVVPTFAALVTLAIGKLAGRRWAQQAARKDHPERAEDFAADITRGELYAWAGILTLLSVGLYLVASITFVQFADQLGWLIGAPWAAIPFGVFLVERYGHDALAEVDAMILQSASDAETERESLEATLMSAEDSWRATWTELDALIRQILDGASSDLNLYDQIVTRADSNSGQGMALAPVKSFSEVAAEGAASIGADSESPRRAVPVTLEAQRGLVTEMAPWLTKELELDLRLLADCRPPIDGGEHRSTRIDARFKSAYQAALADRSESEQVSTPVESHSVEDAPEPSPHREVDIADRVSVGLDENLADTWDRALDEVARG